MKQIVLSLKSKMRFRRWTRKAYAIFASLQSCISIGAIAIPIIKKSLTETSILFFDLFNNNDIEDDQETLLEDILEYNLVVVSTDSDIYTNTNLHQ